MGTFTGENGIWEFDVKTQEWRELETKGEQPEPRSFHTMCALDVSSVRRVLCRDPRALISHEILVQNKLYLHAGCPSSGRLTQLHSLDLSTLEWTALPSAPEPGRGGTVLTALPSSPTSSPLLARFGGFAGYELDGLDLFDVGKQEWRNVEATVEGGGEGPEKRSVHVLMGVDGDLEWEEKRVVAVMALGEREGAPAELGHAGAGFVSFHQSFVLRGELNPTSVSLPSSTTTLGHSLRRRMLILHSAGFDLNRLRTQRELQKREDGYLPLTFPDQRSFSKVD